MNIRERFKFELMRDEKTLIFKVEGIADLGEEFDKFILEMNTFIYNNNLGFRWAYNMWKLDNEAGATFLMLKYTNTEN